MKKINNTGFIKKSPAGGQQGLVPKTLPDVEYGLSV
jgi:hypothetical protein